MTSTAKVSCCTPIWPLYALVKKTVAYIVVDEDDTGRAVIEKWRIKGHRVYGK
jgi:hypothetical protein